MADLEIFRKTVGDMGTNCYIMVNHDTKECIVSTVIVARSFLLLLLFIAVTLIFSSVNTFEISNSIPVRSAVKIRISEEYIDESFSCAPACHSASIIELHNKEEKENLTEDALIEQINHSADFHRTSKFRAMHPLSGFLFLLCYEARSVYS